MMFILSLRNKVRLECVCVCVIFFPIRERSLRSEQAAYEEKVSERDRELMKLLFDFECF